MGCSNMDLSHTHTGDLEREIYRKLREKQIEEELERRRRESTPEPMKIDQPTKAPTKQPEPVKVPA